MEKEAYFNTANNMADDDVNGLEHILTKLRVKAAKMIPKLDLKPFAMEYALENSNFTLNKVLETAYTRMSNRVFLEVLRDKISDFDD